MHAAAGVFNTWEISFGCLYSGAGITLLSSVANPMKRFCSLVLKLASVILLCFVSWQSHSSLYLLQRHSKSPEANWLTAWFSLSICWSSSFASFAYSWWVLPYWAGINPRKSEKIWKVTPKFVSCCFYFL